MTMTDERVDSITRKVRKMRPKRFTVRDAAEKVDRSPDTLRRWRLSGECVPSEHATFGKTTVYLYTPDDIRTLKKVAAAQRPGPKTGTTRRNDASSTKEPAHRREATREDVARHRRIAKRTTAR